MIRLWRIGQKYLDAEFPIDGASRVRIVERPGLWLEPAELDELLDELRRVAAAVLDGGSLGYGAFSRRERLNSAVLTIVYDRSSGDPIAFNAMVLLKIPGLHREHDLVHLGLAMVHPHHRGRNLTWTLYGFSCFFLLARAQLRPLWLSSVSQVPAVIGLVAQNFSNVYPSSPSDRIPSFEHVVVARELMRQRHVFGVGPEARLDESRFIIRDSYTGGSEDLKKTLEETAKHRDPRYSAMCEAELDYGRGDDFIQVGKIDLHAARRYMLNLVPRATLPVLATRLAFLTLQSLLLPPLHWLTPSRPMNELRPRKPS